MSPNALFPLNTSRQEAGFTLVELSIVLVIIGLIVGGVLTGQDLIKAAETRATVGQIEKYNTAVNTFRSKYGGMPGDLSGADTFGLVTRAGGAGHGDGNGLLEGGSAAATVALGEVVLFWVDLSTANLVDGSFTYATDTAEAYDSTEVPTVFPSAKMGRGNYITVYAASGLNYYQIAGIASTAVTGVYSMSANITPLEAFNMDLKIDDGKPNTGTVQGMDAAGTGTATAMNTTATAGAANATACTFTGGATYNTSGSANGTPSCSLRLRFN